AEEVQLSEKTEEETAEPAEEVQLPEKTEEETVEITAKPVEDIKVTTEEPTVEIVEEPVQEITEQTSTGEQTSNEINEALDTVPDLDDEEEELSDDDLDMIEELSKPDEEIPAINPVQQKETPPPPESGTIPAQAEETRHESEAADTDPKSEPAVAQQPSPEPKPEPESEPQQPARSQPQQQAQTKSADEEIQQAAMPKTSPELLQTRANTTPVVPVYSSDIPDEDKVRSDKLQAGDRVLHQEFGEGVVEKMINYGDKLLCSVNFSGVGRRLLNPEISEMRKL
ncbi:MAG: hypothetical protein LUB59_01790, partial [Candidatus Gastranaerophilales bacterium]|nr:hypothetical protein [Candidatus Gastranaerophilales bacterium]